MFYISFFESTLTLVYHLMNTSLDLMTWDVWKYNINMYRPQKTSVGPLNWTTDRFTPNHNNPGTTLTSDFKNRLSMTKIRVLFNSDHSFSCCCTSCSYNKTLQHEMDSLISNTPLLPAISRVDAGNLCGTTGKNAGEIWEEANRDMPPGSQLLSKYAAPGKRMLDSAANQ